MIRNRQAGKKVENGKRASLFNRLNRQKTKSHDIHTILNHSLESIVVHL
jgi:hypothetical protein